MRGRRLCDRYSEGCARLGSWLDAERFIRTGVNTNDRCAPGGLFFRNVIKDYLIAVRTCVEGVLHFVYTESAEIRVVAGRSNN